MSEKVQNFYKKLPQLIDDVVAQMGRFQYAIVFMLCFNSGIIAIANVVTTLYSYQPDFHCKNLEKNQCSSNGTCPDGYIFDDDDDRTIVSEWSLICDRKLYAPLVSSFYFLGLAIGSFVCGIFSDRFGRKPTLFLCLYGQGIIGLSLSFVYDLNWFIGLRFIQGFFVQGMQAALFTLLMEYCSPTKRTLAALGFELAWASGLTFLGGVAYAIRDWRVLQLFLSVPTIATIIWVWFIQESMHWLCTNHREKDAFKVCVRTAKYNGNYGSIEADHLYWLKNIENEEPVSNDNLNGESTHGLWNILRDIFKTACLRKHIFIMASTWFTVAISYYGVIFFMPAVAGDRHLNFIIGAMIEFFAYIPLYFVLDKFGRRIPAMTCLFANGFLIIAIGICSSYDTGNIVQIIVTLFARGASSVLFLSTYVQANELFPTKSRCCAFGICGFTGKGGTLLAPFIVPLAQHVSPLLPMGVLGILSILVGIAHYFLPETLNIQMPNSVEDAKRIWEKANNNVPAATN